MCVCVCVCVCVRESVYVAGGGEVVGQGYDQGIYQLTKAGLSRNGTYAWSLETAGWV